MSEPIYITANGSHLIVHFDDGGNRYARKVAINRWQVELGAYFGKPSLSISNVGVSTARASYAKGDGDTPTVWQVQRSISTSFTSPVTHSGASPWNMTGLSADTAYYVRARAGDGTYWSEWSDTATFTTNEEPTPSAGFRWPFPPNEIGTEWEGYPDHKGVDWPKPEGTPIIASQSGTVEYSGWYSGNNWENWGNMVVINHGAIGQGGAVLRTLYAHMVDTPPVSVGNTVTKGQTIGNVGTTGLSTGNHLHWETSVNGMFNQINPRTFMATYGE